jgi:hypothetical protein
MSDTRASLVLHPVRLRILQAALGREVTTAELAAALADIPTATLYRHVAALVGGGVLEVASERAVRGATERTLRVALPAAHLDAEDVAGLSATDHLDAMTAFLAGILQSASDYLTSPGAAPARDGFGYRQAALWADEEELQAFLGQLRDLLAQAAAQQPRPGRRRRVVTTLLVPDPPAPDAGEDAQRSSSAPSQSPQ